MEPPTSVDPVKLALILCASITFIILGVAAAHFFRRPVEGSFWRLRLNQGTAIALALAHIFSIIIIRGLNQRAMIVGTGCYLTVLAIFLWAQETMKRRPPYLSFSEVHPDWFEDSGPYRFVRHPFYLSYFFIWFAGAIATGNLWLFASALWMTASYAVAAGEEEMMFERTPLAERYRAYALRTGMFFPRLIGARRPAEKTEDAFVRTLILVFVALVLVLAVVLVTDAFWQAAR